MMGWKIRPAEAAEADALSALALRSKGFWGYSPEFLERCRPLLTVTEEYIATHPVFVGVRNGEIGGFYSLARRGAQIELDLLFVEPELVRRGLGRRLLAHAKREARCLGFATMLIESDPGAEGFYMRAGGRRVGLVASGIEADRYLPLLEINLH